MRKVIRIFLVLIVFNSLVFPKIFNTSNYLEIYFLDVGQGDATLIITPDKHKILIDGGPDNSVLSRLSEILPYYDKEIDLLILSHPDMDHVGGLADVSDIYNFEYVMYTDVIGASYESEMFINNVKDSKRLEFLDKNLKVGCCVYVNILWPVEDDLNKYSANDTSIGFELIYKNFNVFFAGDLSAEFENQISDQDTFLDVDVLKVSHHGSKTSTNQHFVQNIKPEMAIISSGKDNKFGHPKKEILQNLDSQGVEILRTDQLGTIRVESDGNKYW